MIFIVEDGTGKSDATSYVSVAEFLSYWDNRLVDYSGEEIDTISNWLNLATQYADSICNWAGTLYSTEQALQIPRADWTDRDGRDYSESVPVFVKNGVCELAAIRQADNFETITNTGIASENYGPVSITYSSDSGSARILYPTAMKYFSRGIYYGGLRAVPT